MVETNDTGPLSIDHSDSIMASGDRSSLNAIMASDEFLCFMAISLLKIWRRVEISKKATDMQNALTPNRFQNEIEARTYLLVISAVAKSRPAPKRRRNILPRQVVGPDVLCLNVVITAPATTIIIASHSS